MPKFYHLSLILDPEGGKLSKRKGAVAVHDFIKQGYMPEAVLNFVALLGWTPAIERNFGEAERELFLLKDMIELFSADDLNKPSPIFNREKLLWFNQKYIQALQIDELQNRFTTWLKETVYDDPELISAITSKGPDYLNKILALEGSRIRLLSEIPDAIRFYYIHKGGIDFLKVKQTKNLTALEVKQIIKEYKALVNLDVAHEEWEKTVRDLAGKLNVKAGSLFMVLRLALTDTSFSPPLFDVMKILGQSEVIARLESYS
jgi:glutamyl/glutaminyl-tRNA synthetase